MSPRKRFWMMAWWAWLVIPAAIGYMLLTSQLRDYRQATIARHASRMSAEAGASDAERTPPPGHENDVPARVKIGAYVDRISEFSIVGSSWKVDFYVWFNWTGDLNPGDTFKLVNGEILTKALQEKTDHGPEHYALYRVTAQITKSFDTSSFPRDEHLLTIAIEDQSLQSYQLAFVTDEAASDISSRVAVAGYKTVGKSAVVKPHAYKTSLGKPGLPPNYKATYSQFVFGITIARPTWGFFTKMFLATYIAVLLALAGLFVRGAGERLGLASTALFVAVINGMEIASVVPEDGNATLADLVNGVSYLVIGQIILQAVLYHRYLCNEGSNPNEATLFDRTSLVLITAIAVVFNLGIVRALTG
jgi:hypothetical protein